MNVIVIGLSGEDVVVSVDQLDLHLVVAGRKPGYVHSIVVTRIRPQPGQIVDVYVQMPDAWRCVEGALPKHRQDAHVLRPVLGLEEALGHGREAVDPQSVWVRARS